MTTAQEPVSCYPIFEAIGSPRELGRAHGEAARDLIQGFLDYLKHSLNFSDIELRRRAARFEPLFHEHCPHLLTETHGLAEGANIHRLDALALQVRGELAGLRDEACTAFAVNGSRTSDGGVLIGQNSDNPPEMMHFGYMLRLIPDHGPRILMWTFGGMLGYHGINEHGVAHFANALGGGPEWKFALPHYPLKRLLLEQRNAVGVRNVLRSVPVCSNGNYVMSLGAGQITDVELTSAGPMELPDDSSGIIVHTNHYRCSDYACEENFLHSLPDSFERQTRMESLLRGTNTITVSDLQRFLSDHAGAPGSICRHQNAEDHHPMLSGHGHTVAALIAEADEGKLHVARGNPCTSSFATYSL
jgi:isopenicillin-N N-acyltransferase-like protein